MWWSWILVSLACWLVAMSWSRLLEQRMIRRLVWQAAKRHNLQLEYIWVHIGWGWPIRKVILTRAQAHCEEDFPRVEQLMHDVWNQLDRRYGEEEEEF